MRFRIVLIASACVHLVLFWPTDEPLLRSGGSPSAVSSVRIHLATTAPVAESAPVEPVAPATPEEPQKQVVDVPPPSQQQPEPSPKSLKPIKPKSKKLKPKPAQSKPVTPKPATSVQKTPEPPQPASPPSPQPTAQTPPENSVQASTQAAPPSLPHTDQATGMPQTPQEAVLGEQGAPTYVSFVPPVYPEQGRRRGIEGEVLVRVMIAADGTAQEATILSCTHPMFAAPARRSALRSTYTPFKKNGMACTGVVRIPMRFELR